MVFRGPGGVKELLERVYLKKLKTSEVVVKERDAWDWELKEGEAIEYDHDKMRLRWSGGYHKNLWDLSPEANLVLSSLT